MITKTIVAAMIPTMVSQAMMFPIGLLVCWPMIASLLTIFITKIKIIGIFGGVE